MLIVWILLGLVVLAAIVGVVTYNGLIGLRNRVEEGWRQIDVELKRRHDLIPNLVETVKGYASHERGTLEEVMQARSAAMSGPSTPAAGCPVRGPAQPGARSPHRRRRGLPRPQGQPELPRTPAGAVEHRGPHRELASLLQRPRARPQHQGREACRRTSSPASPGCSAPSTSRRRRSRRRCPTSSSPPRRRGFGNAPTPPGVPRPSTQPGSVGGRRPSPAEPQRERPPPGPRPPTPAVRWAPATSEPGQPGARNCTHWLRRGET